MIRTCHDARPAAAGLLLLAALAAGACGSGRPAAVKRPEGDVPSAGQFPHAMLTRLLEQAVAPDGLVDYAAVEKNKDLLDAYLGEVARISPIGQPHLFPTEENQVAYWINAHNAAALKGVLLLGRPKDLTGLAGRLDHRPFVFGGHELSLLGVAALLRRDFADARVTLVLVRGLRGGPPLDPAAFEAKDLETRLDADARAFVKNARYVQWTAGSDTVRVSRVILEDRSLFERLEPATVSGDRLLVEGINHFLPGRERILASKVEALPMDLRLNDVSNR